MGAVKICVHKQTDTPYYAETTGNRIFSIEELAYYLYQNIYLADEQIMGEELYFWLQNELEMPELAKRLREIHGAKNAIYEQVMLIMKASEYYSSEELAELAEKIKLISGFQTQERMKFRADDFMRNENYWAAAKEYERILAIRQSTRLSVGFYAAVWNNLGGCYARLFLFEKAANCFENAFQFQKYSEYKEKAHYARKLANYSKQESEELIENKLSKEFVRQADILLKELEEKSRIETAAFVPENFMELRERQYRKISS